MQHKLSVQKLMGDTMPNVVRAMEDMFEEVEKLKTNLELVSKMDSYNFEDS